MKRFSNVLFYISVCLLIITTYYNYFAGEEYPWMKLMILVATIILLAAYVMNVVDRYSGLMVFLNSEKYQFSVNIPLGVGPRNWRRMTFGFSVFFGIFFGAVFCILDAGTFYAGIILLVSGLEKLIYYLISLQKSWFRVGLNENFMVINNGGLTLISFKGLQAMEEKYDEILFRFSNGEVKAIYTQTAADEQQENFLNTLREIAHKKNASINLNH